MDFTLFSDGRNIPHCSFLNSTSFPDVLVNLSDTQLPMLNITPINSNRKIQRTNQSKKSATKLIELEKEIIRDDCSNQQHLSQEKIAVDVNNFNSSIDSLTDRVQSLLGRTGDGNSCGKPVCILTPIMEKSKEKETSALANKNHKKLNYIDDASYEKFTLTTPSTSAISLSQFESQNDEQFGSSNLNDNSDKTIVPISMPAVSSETDIFQNLPRQTGDYGISNEKAICILTPIMESSKEKESSTFAKNTKRLNYIDNTSYEKFTLTTPSASAISLSQFEPQCDQQFGSVNSNSSDKTSAPISLSTESSETDENINELSPKLCPEPKKSSSQRRVKFFSNTKLIDIPPNTNNREDNLVTINDPSSILNEVNKVLEKIQLIKERSKSSSLATSVGSCNNDKQQQALTPSSSAETIKSMIIPEYTDSFKNRDNIVSESNQLPKLTEQNLDLILTDESEPTQYYRPPDFNTNFDKLLFLNETFQSHIYNSPIVTNAVPNFIKRSATFIKEVRHNNKSNDSNNLKSVESMLEPPLPLLPSQPESRPESASSSTSRLSSTEGDRVILQQQEAKFLQLVDRQRSHLRSIQKELVRLEKAYLKQQPSQPLSANQRQSKQKKRTAKLQSAAITSDEIQVSNNQKKKSTNSDDNSECQAPKLLPNHLLLTKREQQQRLPDINSEKKKSSNINCCRKSSSTSPPSTTEIDTFLYGAVGHYGSANVLHQKHCKLAQQVSKQIESSSNSSVSKHKRELEQKQLQQRQANTEHLCQCCCCQKSRRHSKMNYHLDLDNLDDCGEDFIYHFDRLQLNHQLDIGGGHCRNQKKKILHKDDDPCCINNKNNGHFEDYRSQHGRRPNSINVDQSVQTSLIIDTSRTNNAIRSESFNHEPSPQDNTKKKKPVAWELTFDDLNRINNSSTNARKVPKRSSPNLQDAFTRNCNQFKLRSARRVRLIKDNADLRVQTADQRRNEIAETYFMKKKIESEQRQASAASNSARTSGTKPKTINNSNNKVVASTQNPRYPRPLPMISRRVFTHREMRAQTEKVYSKLPEVKAQKVTVKREDEARRRRMMADIFKQRLKESVIRGKLNWPITTQAISTVS